MFTTVEEACNFIATQEIEYVDVRFCDLPGAIQQVTIPASQFTPEIATDGVMFDGSSVRGFTTIQESDMKLMPDVETAYIDPFRTNKTLVVNFYVVDPLTGESFSRDPRNVAIRAEDYLVSSGIADSAVFGAEAEFYVFDDVRFTDDMQGNSFFVDSSEAWWNTGRKEEGGNLGYKIRVQGGYFPASPIDQMIDLRNTIASSLEAVGLRVERAHHEVGTAGQQEINYRFNSLLHAADDMMKFKYVVKNVAHQYGKTATFMPKPLYGENGSGMHCHQSLWKDGEPLFADPDGYAGLSATARHYIGGLLKHAPSILALTNPSINSFRRLVPGFEAPIHLAYSARNRSACIRIPITGTSPKAKRIEYRTPDPSANPYLAFSAQLMAGLDGIINEIEPGAPIDKNLYDLNESEQAKIAHIPSSLEDALLHLEADHEFLTRGGVFPEDLIETWIRGKRETEIAPHRLRPHPYEFALYYDV